MGGVGETALALKLAEQLAVRFLDAQFYIELRGVSAQPLSIADAMAQVIRSYQPDAHLSDDVSELSALYRSVLYQQKALLLLDNAAGADQVEPLIPPPTCLLLDTSRQRFTVPGMLVKSLEPLSAQESQELLLRIAPRIREQADILAAFCGKLPLALRLAASSLAMRIDLAPADWIKRLRNAGERLKLVDASLTLSYELLSDERKQQWCALACSLGSIYGRRYCVDIACGRTSGARYPQRTGYL